MFNKLDFSLLVFLTFIMLSVVITFYSFNPHQIDTREYNLSESIDGYTFLFDSKINTPSNYITEKQIYNIAYERLLVSINGKFYFGRVSNVSDSMRGIINYNTTPIYLYKSEFTINDLHIGDIIDFRDNLGGNTTHRIIGIIKDKQNETFFITKGDNNKYEDKMPVPFERVNGKLIGVLY